MRVFSFAVLLLVLWLATCSGPQPKAPAPTAIPTQTEIPATATAIPPMPTETLAPVAKLPAAPFDSQTYINEDAGFAIDYPTGWTVNEMVVGSRGTQIQFLSKPELVDAVTIPDGETRFGATIYLWDPKNDLTAFSEHIKEAQTGSGSTILDEQNLTLEQGLPAVQFTTQTPDSQQVVFLITVLNDKYLVLTGEGNLDLAKQMMQRLRPIT